MKTDALYRGVFLRDLGSGVREDVAVRLPRVEGFAYVARIPVMAMGPPQSLLGGAAAGGFLMAVMWWLAR